MYQDHNGRLEAQMIDEAVSTVGTSTPPAARNEASANISGSRVVDGAFIAFCYILANGPLTALSRYPHNRLAVYKQLKRSRSASLSCVKSTPCSLPSTPCTPPQNDPANGRRPRLSPPTCQRFSCTIAPRLQMGTTLCGAPIRTRLVCTSP